MAMSKKDFVALADHIRPMEPSDEWLRVLAQFCRSQNPEFKRERWIGYVKGENGPNGGAVKKGQ